MLSSSLKEKRPRYECGLIIMVLLTYWHTYNMHGIQDTEFSASWLWLYNSQMVTII